MNKSIRTLAIMLAAFASIQAFGQKKGEPVEVYPMPVSEQTKLITYQDVVPMKAEPAVLYDRAFEWANHFFQNPTKVIQTADKEKGVIVCRSNMKIHTPAKDGKTMVMAGVVTYELRIELRDGRYRYTITNFTCKNGQVTQPCEQWLDKDKPEWTPVRYNHLTEIDTHIKTLIESLEEGMGAKEEFKDDW
ncbi:MAG: DUF4468 domain-containing protein [Bacteroidales bacterium]|nr:DUF4468 domain-containing protein [Bacteroidales bacterium]